MVAMDVRRASYLKFLSVDFHYQRNDSDGDVQTLLLETLEKAENLKYLRINLMGRPDLQAFANDLNHILAYVLALDLH